VVAEKFARIEAELGDGKARVAAKTLGGEWNA
jgi:hypothetical protein